MHAFMTIIPWVMLAASYTSANNPLGSTIQPLLQQYNCKCRTSISNAKPLYLHTPSTNHCTSNNGPSIYALLFAVMKCATGTSNALNEESGDYTNISVMQGQL